MKSTPIFLVFGLAALASAQSQCDPVASAIPSCGTSCITSAASAVGCAYTDYACQCSSSQSAAIQSRALNCVVGACGINTALQVQASAEAVCACVTSVGANSPSTTAIATPTAAPTTDSSTSSTASPASSPSSVLQPTSSVPAGSSSTAVSGSSSTAVAGSSSTAVAGSSSTAVAGSSTTAVARSSSVGTIGSSAVTVAPSCTGVTSPVPSKNATVTYTKPSITATSTSLFTGGAATVIGTTGGIAGALLAIIAAL
ncbi:hypothetical protein M432DRAFT_438768 [Thermoascus aurantiacus ATCC 26904]